MLGIEGYKVREEIYRSNKTIIYRAIRNKDLQKVIIKLLKNEYPTLHDINKFKYEYNIIKQLEGINGIIKQLDLIKYKNSNAIIMEDINGEGLNNIIYKKNIDIKTFLKLSIKITEIINNVHKANIIHKDIKPANIIVNLENMEVRIIDFSIATQMIKEIQEITNPEILEGTLAYISPEQTGRINKLIDYRTDFYSLGVTFYEMITKKLPFESEDPLELIYFHIAKKPVMPNRINQEIPLPISNIIMKLLSKNSEDRYQSATGLKFDLERCYKTFKNNRKINNFVLGRKDIFQAFQIPQNLYGREKEINLILNSYNKILNGTKEVVLVSGSPGVGKSALINQIQKTITEKKGFYIYGKYEDQKNNIPYYGIIQAFQELIKLILTESEENILKWKNKIIDALGEDGKVIINIIPELELIIGKQHELEFLPLKESQFRFNIIFENFIRLFATKEHPLILTLDDIHWIDKASMQLIEVLLKDIDLKYFLLIGTYREQNNILPAFKKIIENKFNLNHIDLDPLKLNEINLLLLNTFKSIRNTENLSKLILSKTNGNPFFIIEFLKTLYNEKLIVLRKNWEYNLNKINETEATDNVINFIVNRIKKLPANTIQILKTASCIGNRSEIDLLCILNNVKYNDILEQLKSAFGEGIIIKEKDAIKFIHDRIKDSIYKLIHQKEKEKLHYLIGKTLLNEKAKKVENLFDVVNHLNLCTNLLNEKEKNNLILLNLKAGNNAKKSSAFNSASIFYRNGIKLLNKFSWDNQYEIALEIFLALAESEYMSTNYSNAEKIFNLILKKAKKTDDIVKAYEIMILYYTNKLKFKEAIEIGIKILNKLGFKFPKVYQINFLSTILELIKFNKLLNEKFKKNNIKQIENLRDLTETKNPLINKIASILFLLATPFYSTYPDKYPYIILKLANTGFIEGFTVYSCAALCPLGSIFIIAFNKYKVGNELGKLSLKLTKKFQNKFYSCFIESIFSITLHHFINHAKDSIPFLKSSIKNGLASGNIQFTSYSLNNLCIKYLFVGNNLEFVKDQYDNNTNLLLKLNQQDAFSHFFPIKQLAYNLLGLSEDKFKLKGEFFNEDVEISKIVKFKQYTGLSIVYTIKLLLLIILGDYKKAYNSAVECEKYLSSDLAQIQVLFAHFFIALAYIKNIDDSNKKQKKLFLSKALKYLAKIKKWHESCEANFSQLYYLLLAEISRFKKNEDLAIEYYNKAIGFAKKYEYIYIEALSNELAALYFKSKGIETVYRTYMTEAVYCYERWGAKAKIDEMQKSYPEIFESILNSNQLSHILLKNPLLINNKGDIKDSSSSGSQIANISLDIESIIKATQTISSEIEMKGLLTKLIKILLTNSGAQIGIIAMHKNEKFLVEAEYRTGQANPKIMNEIPVEKYHNLSHSIINYVEHTKDLVLLNDASKKNRFMEDPYIKKNKPKSILCIPIIQQNNLLGLLYLENNLTTNAFSFEHQEVTKIIASLAAISIENVFLYQNLKEKELIEKELKIASNIQKSMLPLNLPSINGYDISAECIMAKEAGGDFYDLVPIDENKFLIVIGDISGKGMSAALYMSSTLNIIRTIVEVLKNKKNMLNLNTVYISQQINKLLLNIMQKGKFATIMIGILDTKLHTISFTSNGHEPFIIFNPEKKYFNLENTKGQACGVIQAELFDKSIKVKSVKINRGDYLIFYTDGITEAKNEKNEEYMEKYYENIKTLKGKESADTVINYLIKATNQFSKNTPQYDDMTMVCIRKI